MKHHLFIALIVWVIFPGCAKKTEAPQSDHQRIEELEKQILQQQKDIDRLEKENTRLTKDLTEAFIRRSDTLQYKIEAQYLLQWEVSLRKKCGALADKGFKIYFAKEQAHQRIELIKLLKGEPSEFDTAICGHTPTLTEMKRHSNSQQILKQREEQLSAVMSSSDTHALFQNKTIPYIPTIIVEKTTSSMLRKEWEMLLDRINQHKNQSLHH